MNRCKRLNSIRHGLEVIVIVILVKTIRYYTGFKYSLFKDGLSFKLIVDFSIWIIIYLLVSEGIEKLKKLFKR